MLVKFTVKNFRSFKEEQTFSMEASSETEHTDSIINESYYSILPMAVFYGANSSGKSNLIKAMSRMKRMIRFSVHLNEGDELPYEPFALDKNSNYEPTLFEAEFLKKGIALYRYGFEYNKNEIVSEWLYEKDFKKKGKEKELFIRMRNTIEVSPEFFSEGAGKEEMTNTNRLFLSLVAQLKGKKSNSVMDWFSECNTLSGIDSEGYQSFTLKMFMQNLAGSEQAQDFFKTLQLGFTHFSTRKKDFPEELIEKLPDFIESKERRKKIETYYIEGITKHNIYGKNGDVIDTQEFNMNKMESEGTKKVIEISGPLFDTLSKGRTLFIDELDAKLHPILTRNIMLLFMEPHTNPNGAQLVFATHDTNQLDLGIIRRDQIWFAEKNRFDSTEIYSLIEFDDNHLLSTKHDLKSNYIRGRYGAIPFIQK